MGKKICSDRCGICCEKWNYPRKYHNNPLKYISELKTSIINDQKGVKLIPHPKYKSYLSCAYLRRKKNGTTTCSIYKNRPVYCKNFFCL